MESTPKIHEPQAEEIFGKRDVAKPKRSLGLKSKFMFTSS